MTLFELFGLLRKHLGFVIAVSIACTAVTAVVCYFLPNKKDSIKTLLLTLWKSEEEKISKTESGELGSAVFVRRNQSK